MTYTYQNGVKRWDKYVPFEDKTIKQLENLTTLPFIHKHVAAMPDAHVGKGATVGSVIATKNAIIPAAVGVDLSCGMVAVMTSLTASDLPDDLSSLRSRIEESIPIGNQYVRNVYSKGRWHDPSEDVVNAMSFLNEGLKGIVEKHPKLRKNWATKQLGSLGGGNHFIEVCLDEDQNVWVMLHSGSRGIGNMIGTYFIEKAKEDMRTYHINLPDKDLAYLPEGTQHFDDYVEALHWAGLYAHKNREVMLNIVLKVISEQVKPFTLINNAINVHHNYATMENHFGENVWVTRKGAIRAREGDLGIIPSSMATGSAIVRGLGNKESFCSCSHGSGRVMSRTQAKKMITMEDHIEATKGVECRQDAGVIDESPAAYKDFDSVMRSQEDLVVIEHRIKQVLNIKG